MRYPTRAGSAELCKVCRRFLVVEDDDLIQSVVEETLKDGGFEIHIASSAKQAVEKFDGAAANIGDSSPT